MLGFYLDQHVKRAVTDGLRRRGVDVVTAYDDDQSRTDDEDLLIRAAALGRVLVTQDKDFLRIAARWQSDLRPFPGIVFAAQERVDTGQLIEYLELIARLLSADEIRGRVEHVPA